MRNFTIYLALLLCLFASKMMGQEKFEDKAKAIADKIEAVTKQEKATLKTEVDAVNKELEAGTITDKQADDKKLQLAEMRAKNIETKVNEYETELRDLVQQKVDGKLKDDGSKTFTFHWSSKNDSIRRHKGEPRTTSQFVFAFGANNLATDGKIAGSDYRYAGSHFYEWGTTWNTRIMKNDNLLHAKYGISVMYNNLRPTDNRYFVDNGSETSLETSPINLKDSRFRNVYIVVPLHLEFDFSGSKTIDGKKAFKSHEGFRLGVGGYAGLNVKSKQILRYNDDGYKTKSVTKGNFNVNDFIYGVSAYVGYGETSLYVKYDLNPLFKNNAVDQNNISLGVRFDLL
ncbi:MAG: hypothetical protein PSV16_13835 [Flavobacterium sp.]|nr:hypothetical protein [Flavobacterium sp.]